MSAEVSDCGRYRYALWRDIGGLLGPPSTCLFVMLNPSTADASEDDPTIRRCISFARGLGYGKLAVGNLYALRATNPRELLTVPDPVGPENDLWLLRLHEKSDLTVVAWGAFPSASKRVAILQRTVLDRLPNKKVVCLGTTKDGHPRHPLYVHHETKLEDWSP